MRACEFHVEILNARSGRYWENGEEGGWKTRWLCSCTGAGRQRREGRGRATVGLKPRARPEKL
eukprot:7843201-Pyramimonas_sp.AAC.1